RRHTAAARPGRRHRRRRGGGRRAPLLPAERGAVSPPIRPLSFTRRPSVIHVILSDREGRLRPSVDSVLAAMHATVEHAPDTETLGRILSTGGSYDALLASLAPDAPAALRSLAVIHEALPALPIIAVGPAGVDDRSLPSEALARAGL